MDNQFSESHSIPIPRSHPNSPRNLLSPSSTQLLNNQFSRSHPNSPRNLLSPSSPQLLHNQFSQSYNEYNDFSRLSTPLTHISPSQSPRTLSGVSFGSQSPRNNTRFKGSQSYQPPSFLSQQVVHFHEENEDLVVSSALPDYTQVDDLQLDQIRDAKIKQLSQTSRLNGWSEKKPGMEVWNKKKSISNMIPFPSFSKCIRQSPVPPSTTSSLLSQQLKGQEIQPQQQQQQRRQQSILVREQTNSEVEPKTISIPKTETEQKPTCSGSTLSSSFTEGRDKRSLSISVPRMAPLDVQYDVAKKRAKAQRQKIIKSSEPSNNHPLFAHLRPYEKRTSQSINLLTIHPEIHRVGLQFATNQILGSNARCLAMLEAFRSFVTDFQPIVTKTSDGGTTTATLAVSIDQVLKPQIQFLIDCRPLSFNMANAIKTFRYEIARAKINNYGDEEARNYLLKKIDSYINMRILVATSVISDTVAEKINDGDVILTHGSSYSVETAFVKAHSQGKNFRVVVVNSKEGRILITRLSEKDIDCSFIPLNAISYIMKDVTMIFVGAFAMMSNGSLLSRVGTAVIGAMAKSYNVPFVVCCETYKFSERVQLDSICFNQLGDPEDLLQGDDLKGEKKPAALKFISLLYDLTPMEFINVIVTEVGMVPPTSVPAIIREHHRYGEAE